jgi:hypothetical protein
MYDIVFGVFVTKYVTSSVHCAAVRSCATYRDALPSFGIPMFGSMIG